MYRYFIFSKKENIHATKLDIKIKNLKWRFESSKNIYKKTKNV